MKKTLGDRAIDFYRNYIAPSKEDIEKGKKEEKLSTPPDSLSDKKESFGTKKLSMAKCRKTANQSPLFMKGARKKAMDSIRAWFILETKNQKTTPVEQDLNILDTFEKRTQFKMKWYEARVASFVYGDGYLLITFENDENTDLHDPPAKRTVGKGKDQKTIPACPWKVRVLNSEFIKEIDYYPKNVEYYKKIFTKHFHYEDTKNNADYWIHPDRIIHITCDKLPNNPFGNSKVNLLRNIIKSMINIDIASGEILAWFAHGAYDIKEDGLDDNRRQFWEKIAKQHPGAWIHDETADIKAINPQAIDPKPFYEYIVLKTASAFRMPTHILTGIQVGKVTGAEVGMGDYVKDIKDDQDLMYTPLIETLYETILKAKDRKWKYNLVWNAIYIDELAEAEIMHKRVEAATLALNGQRGAGGFINKKEARLMYNKGQIELDAENIPTDIPKPPAPPKPPQDSDNDDDDKDNAYTRQLDDATKAMIKKRKLQAANEKKLGDEIIEEQDKDVTDNDSN